MALASVVVPYPSVPEKSQQFDTIIPGTAAPGSERLKELREFLTTNIECVDTTSSAISCKNVRRKNRTYDVSVERYLRMVARR
jgi:hypothetical protein